MSEDKNFVSVICREGETSKKGLICNPLMIEDLVSCCRERVSLGETKFEELLNFFSGLNEGGVKTVKYHNDCRKPIVNKIMIARLKSKRSRTDSPSSSGGGPGRPPSTPDSARPKRSKTVAKEEICLFARCDFCGIDRSDPLHKVLSNAMGGTLLQIKQKTLNDQVSNFITF